MIMDQDSTFISSLMIYILEARYQIKNSSPLQSSTVTSRSWNEVIVNNAN